MKSSNHIKATIDGHLVKVTRRGLDLLLSIGHGLRHVQGAEVLVSRRLFDEGLVTIADDGAFGPGPRSNQDGERWCVSLTSLGALFCATIAGRL